MNNFTYENQGTNTYLVYRVSADDVIDSMSLGMLTNNKISGLAPTLFTQLDTVKYVKYNVSAKISVQQFFSGPVNRKRLIGVFKAVVDAMLSAEEYMIDINSILLDLDYVFADVSTCETVLICLPIQKETQGNVDLGAFFKNIMFTTQFDQTENCDYVAKIINYLNSVPVFSLESFKELLISIADNNYAQPVVARATSAPVAQPVVATVNPAAETPKRAPQPVTPQPVNIPNPVQQPTNIPKQNPQPVVQPINIPKQTPNAVPQPVNVPNAYENKQEEKKMSMFNLLMHYNKENAAIYKEQKKAKKESKQQNVVAQNAVPNNVKQPKKPVAQPSKNAGFAVPGQPAQVVSQPAYTQPVGYTQAKQNTPVAPTAVPKRDPVVKPVNPTPAPVSIPTPVVPQGQSMNYGETTVLGVSNIGETTVLGATTVQVNNDPYLIRTKNNEKIMLNKPVFRIGKERSYVDYFIGDNTAVSRSHANVISRDGEYFVMDTNSTNHTYVNGSMLQSNVETKIKHGDKIRIANEEFEFKLY